MIENKVDIITGFHAIEEQLKKISSKKHDKTGFFRLYYSNPGPRVKKILLEARRIGVECVASEKAELEKMVSSLDKSAQDHRGVVLAVQGQSNGKKKFVDFDTYLKKIHAKESDTVTIFLLDSVTDPHNVGAIIRSCDQLGVDLLVIPESNSSKDSEVIGRSSAGANAWVPVAIVPNLVRAVKSLKENGFWVYGADAGGVSAHTLHLNGKTAVIMGSEGSGIGRLLKENCDGIVSIATCGKLDSLNVSVAAGILMYEIRRQQLV